MAALNNFGVTLSKGMTAIADVTSISGPSVSVDGVDITTLTSTGGWEEPLPTVIRSGSVSVSVNMDPVTHATHFVDLTARTIDAYTLTFNDDVTPSKFDFNAYVESFEVADITPDGKLEATISFKLSGPMTFTPGAPV